MRSQAEPGAEKDNGLNSYNTGILAAIIRRAQLAEKTYQRTNRMKKAAVIWVARHGETEWSAAGKHTGLSDIPLDSNGRRQARELGHGIRAMDARFAAVYSSALGRARETAGLAGFADAQIMPQLHEWDYGEFEGRSSEEVRRQLGPDWVIWTAAIEQGESLQAVGERADAVIERLLQADGDVLVFAHGQFLRVLAARWAGLPAVAGQRLALDTGTISKLGYEHECRVITFWNSPIASSEAAPVNLPG